MAAVRVPPSAWRTSQSRTFVFSPNALVSTTARRERPTSREISWVRPPIRPLTDSRSERVFVDAGSMAYSAVTQPSPDPLRQRGTPSLADAAHSTRVFPNSTSTDPAAWSSQLREIVTVRSSLLDRPSARVMRRPYRRPTPDLGRPVLLAQGYARGVGPPPAGRLRYQRRHTRRCTGIQRGMERSPGMRVRNIRPA